MTDRQRDLIFKIDRWRTIVRQFPDDSSAKEVLKALHVELRKTMHMVRHPWLRLLSSPTKPSKPFWQIF